MTETPLDAERALTLRLRRSLSRCWPSLFGRFGRLTEVQLRAMPVLLGGHDALICAPTATGKTEAALAPLVEALLARAPEDMPGLVRLLYITPTRALANDLDQRLRGMMADLGLRFAVRTGERREIDDGKPVDLLVTTPESLDSILCRRRRDFTHIEAVVLDEIHLLDGGPRGDQLRVLLRRLHRVRPGAPPYRTVALSATVAAPDAVAERYLPGGRVVQVAGQRPFHETFAQDLDDVVETLRSESLRKALIFVNARRQVEEVVDALRRTRWPADRVIAHHGSLGRRQRTEAEAALRQWSWGIAVATTTLEIGIDIGNIDCVVLWDLPRGLEALLQRMGRACRRGDLIRVIAVAASEPTREAFQAAFASARGGDLEPREYRPQLGVAVQQVFSALYQARGGLDRNELNDLLEPLAPPDTVRQILAQLTEDGHVHERRRRLALSQHWVDEADKGRVHSNLDDERQVAVVDARTGAELGEAAVADDAEFVRLAGRTWRIVKRMRGRVLVEPQNARSASTRFGARSEDTPFSKYLPEALREPPAETESAPPAQLESPEDPEWES